MSKPIQIFKPGKHVALSGMPIEFSEAQLKACAAAYDPEVFKAPLVVGHPKLTDPAYGWVKELSFADGFVMADPDQVDAEFAEMVNAGKFPKVSASFYLPDSPNNPKPGVLYLKHVGFLGATAPAVKGLKTVNFAEGDVGVVEFADWDQLAISGLFRGIRDFIVEKFGLDAADKVLPSYQIDSLTISAARNDDTDDLTNPQYSESETPMTKEEVAEMDRLKAENTTLSGQVTTLTNQVANFAEEDTKRATDARHTSNVEFAEGLIKEGKLLPAQKDSTISTLDHLATLTNEVEFGEGDAKHKTTPLEIHKKTLQASPKLVEFSEKAGSSILAPEDVLGDSSQLAVAAVEFAETEAAAGRHVNSAEAVAHVKKKLGSTT